MRAQFLLFFSSTLLSAQSFSFGAKVGVPTGKGTESRPFTAGPVVELRWRNGFAIEAGALYRRLGTTYGYNYFPNADTSASLWNRVRGNSWEFPLVGKYYFRARRSTWQPFLGTGWALRTIGWQYQGSTTTTVSGQSPQVFPFNVGDRSPLGAGATFVGGLRVRIGPIQWQPEVRYTRWGQQDGAISSPRNEAGIFLGFRF